MSLGSFLVILSSLAFGTLALFAQRSYEAGFGQITLLMVRFGIATALLLLVAIWKKPTWPDRKKLIGLLVMGGLYVGQSFTFFAALKHVPASMVSLLLYLYPGIVTLAAVLLFRERMFLGKWIAVGLAIVGSVLIIGVSGKGNVPGITFGIGTAVFYSAYLLVGTKVLVGTDSLASSTIVIGTAAVTYGILASLQGYEWPSQSIGWVWATSLAVVPTFLAISTLLAGLDRIGPVATSTLAAVEPLATAILSVAFLGERMGLVQVLGGACILAAVLLLAKASSKAKTRQAVSSAST
ncbi:MAG: EamA family transporter [Chlorobia bacterium]|nr:EamA family transporter [Fimbriimonadaceae bacterium]